MLMWWPKNLHLNLSFYRWINLTVIIEEFTSRPLILFFLSYHLEVRTCLLITHWKAVVKVVLINKLTKYLICQHLSGLSQSQELIPSFTLLLLALLYLRIPNTQRHQSISVFFKFKVWRMQNDSDWENIETRLGGTPLMPHLFYTVLNICTTAGHGRPSQYLDNATNRLPFIPRALSVISEQATFYRVHLAVFTFIPLISSAIFYASNGNYKVDFVDAMFLCYSAMTVTGLATVNLSTITAWQQAILYFLMAIVRTTVLLCRSTNIAHHWNVRVTGLLSHGSLYSCGSAFLVELGY